MFEFPDYQSALSKIESISFSPHPSTYSYSDTQFRIIKRYIEDFQNALDEDHEVGLLLTNFGQSTLMQVTDIGYEESVLMVFKGFVNGKPSTLIQHVSQLNFLLTSLRKKDPAAPPRRIGFNAHWEE